MKKRFCKIDNSTCISRSVFTRSNKKIKLYYCKKCDFEFFSHDPRKSLEQNKLDISRLKKAGLKIPKLVEDFKNGILQSKIYINNHMDKKDKKKNILEVGCSWGYFLSLIKKQGSFPYGLEINKIKSSYVNKKLKIRCEKDITRYEHEGIKFDKIFLFYVLEYIPNPSEYLNRLFRLLKKKGSLIIYTPNKNDVLKSILKSKEYIDFFYDENSVNYFSKKSLVYIMKKLKIRKYKIELNQGYSFINFINWFLNKCPSKTGIVGGDRYVDKLIKNLKTDKKNKGNAEISKIRNNLIKLFRQMDISYKKILKPGNVENQLILKVTK